MKILLMGTGMQGKAALHDLACQGDVGKIVAADRDLASLRKHVADKGYGEKVRCEHVDVHEPGTLNALLAEKPDVAIDLLPVQHIGFVAGRAVAHGVHLVNTCYARPAVRAHADEAAARGVTILPECGMDPGIDLLLLGEAVCSLDEVHSIRCYGAGIPEAEAADPPLNYKVTWTFEGVLKSYRRAARFKEGGQLRNIDEREIFAPGSFHSIDIPGLGRLEAFPNGDAISFAEQLGLPVDSLSDMGRYALRWPGHCALWKQLVDLGLLDDDELEVDGRKVDRRRYLARSLEPLITLGDTERDVVVVRIEVEGKKDGRPARALQQVIDRRDLATGLTAMNRTVGFSAAIGALLIARGELTQRGLLAPVRDLPYAAFTRELSTRGIMVEAETSFLD